MAERSKHEITRPEEIETKEEKEFSFEEGPGETVEVEAVKVMSKKERDNNFLSEEQREKFILDPSAEKKLMGSLEKSVVDAKVEAFRNHIINNPETFGKGKNEAETLSELQVRHIMEGYSDEVIEIASRDPRYAEMMHLREMLREASGDMNYDEKLMFFKRIDKGVVKDPALLRELQIKLWEAKEGENFDKTAFEKIGLGEKEDHIKERVEEYRTNELLKAMGIGSEKIDERKELEKEKGKDLSDDEVKKIMIQETGEDIKKRTGSEWTDEEIMALTAKGYDLNQAQSVGFILKKIKIGDNLISLKELKAVADEEKGFVTDGIKKETEKAEKEWDSKMIETKDNIIKEALEEIPEESAKRVYDKYKKIRLFSATVESKIEKNKENNEIFSEMYGDRADELGEITDELYDCDSVAEFKKIVGKLHGDGLKDYVLSQNLAELAKKKKGQKRFWFERFFDLTVDFLATEQKGVKKKK